jgi:hypothetical protein
MSARWIRALWVGMASLLLAAMPAQAQAPAVYPSQAYQLNRFYYYPYYYFPHNYWPAMGPRWPEPPGMPYQPPPAYMAYPPFKEPNWHYDLWSTMPYYRGFHFWLDQF